MFSDETRVRCPSCKEFVSKEEMPSCIQWCSQARECLGEARWRELMGSAGDGGTGDDDAGGEPGDDESGGGADG